MPVHIQIIERRITAPSGEQARRQEQAEKLNNLGLIDLAQGQVATEATAGFEVTVNGTAVPVLASHYEVLPGEGGPSVLLRFTADANYFNAGRLEAGR